MSAATQAWVADRLAQAQHLIAEQRHAAARSVLERLLEQAPDLAEAHHLLGLVLHEAGLFSGAQQAFATALEKDPEHTAAALSLAVLHNDLGHYAAARAIYGRASARCQAAPQQLDPYVAHKLVGMHLELAQAYRQAGQGQAALQQLRQAQALQPQRGGLRRLEAALLEEVGRGHEAARVLEAAHRQHPQDGGLTVDLGVCCFRRGNAPRATELWRRAASGGPHAAAARRFLRLSGAPG